MIPACIYTIPPSSPLFHEYVYGGTPEYVYVGYTPSYMGAFVSDGVVVFGAGLVVSGNVVLRRQCSCGAIIRIARCAVSLRSLRDVPQVKDTSPTESRWIAWTSRCTDH